MATVTIFISEALHFALEFIICSPMKLIAPNPCFRKIVHCIFGQNIPPTAAHFHY